MIQENQSMGVVISIHVISNTRLIPDIAAIMSSKLQFYAWLQYKDAPFPIGLSVFVCSFKKPYEEVPKMVCACFFQI